MVAAARRGEVVALAGAEVLGRMGDRAADRDADRQLLETRGNLSLTGSLSTSRPAGIETVDAPENLTTRLEEDTTAAPRPRTPIVHGSPV